MSFIAPYAFTGAVSLYLGYKTYSSYYSNSEFEELDKDENIYDESKLNQVAKELVDSIIEKVVKNIEDEQCSIEDEQCSIEDEPLEKELIELPKTRKDLEEEVKKYENKIMEEVKKEANLELTNYDNIVKVVNKTLEKMDQGKEKKIEEIKIVITDVETNNDNVVEEVVSVEKIIIDNGIVKSPIQLPRHHNNLKKRKRKKNKK